MLKAAFNSFSLWAKTLERETGIVYSAAGREVIQQMADGYCLAKDTGDEKGKNMYIAGLMLRYWYAINKLKEKSPITGLDYTDFMAWLYEAIEYACKYRAWQDPNKKVNAQQCLNMCIQTKLRERYYFANLDKHRANQNTISFDTPLNSDLEDGNTLADIMVGDEGPSYGKDSLHIVQEYLNQNKIIEAIILDTIAFKDTFKHNKTTVKEVLDDGTTQKYAKYTSEFWPYKVVQCVSQLPVDFYDDFLDRYSVAAAKLNVALETIRKASNQKLYRYLDKTLADARAMLM